MAITIHDGWLKTTNNQQQTIDITPSNNFGGIDTSGMADNMRHCIWSGFRSAMWRANWDWSSGSNAEVQALARAVTNRANDMTDFSYCWCGLGYESYLSRAQYVSYWDYKKGLTDKPYIYQDNSTNTPWSFDIYEVAGSPATNRTGQTWEYGDWRNTKNKKSAMYCWKNLNNISNPNNNNDYWPNSVDQCYQFVNRKAVQAIAPRNWVNLIVVIAKKDLDSVTYGVNSNVCAFDLYTYCNTNVHETYKYIIEVDIVPYIKSNALNYRSSIAWGDARNPNLSLSRYIQPAISGKLLFTSDDTVQNFAHTSSWHNSDISPIGIVGDYNSVSINNYSGLGFTTDINTHVQGERIPIMGAVYYDTTSNNLRQNQIFPYKDKPEIIIHLGDNKWKEHEGHYTDQYGYEYDGVCYYREYDNTFYDDCMKQTACFGLLFTDRYSVAYNGDIDDRFMFLGVLDEHNIGHGEYTHGYDNLDQPQLNWTNTTDTDYTPSYNPPIPSVDPNTYGTPWNYNSPDMCNTGQQYYSLTGANVEKIVGDLWAALDTKPSDISVTDYCKEKYLSNNPLDVVVSLKRFPFELPTGAQQNPENIVLGTFETSAEGYTLPLSYKWVYLGSCSLYEYFGGNFLDYDLTTAQLYIPFCGTIEIDVPFFMGKGLEIYMAVDYYTGACTAYVQRVEDKMVYATVNGNCSIDLPITGIQSATLNSTLLNAKQSVIGGAVGAVGKTIAGAAAIGAATVATGGAALVGGLIGGAASVASGLLSGAQADTKNYELHHTQIPLKQIGANSGQNSWCGELRPILYLYRPIIADNYNAADYGHTIGFATCVSDTIGNYSGYTEATNVDLSGFAATDEEKTAINNLLVRGVYL